MDHPIVVGIEPRKCSHPKPLRRYPQPEGGWWCACGHAVSAQKVSAGRRARNRGNAKERASARRNGTQRTGHHSTADFLHGMFAFSNKARPTAAFPQWMSRQLDYIRAAYPEHEPILHVEETPGPGRKPRRLYVMDERTWFALHGPVTPLQTTPRQ
jgi:hypothetical protein